MNEPSIFKAWENFYVIAGSSSAALTGLVFIVVTLAADRRRTAISTTSDGTSIFSSPTVVHFCAAFFVSGIFAAPWHSAVYAAILIGLAGLFGAAYAVNTGYRARKLTTYNADRGDWIWFIILPFIAYLMLCAGSFSLPLIPDDASYVVAASTMLLIFVGIHNAWDVVTYLAINSDDK